MGMISPGRGFVRATAGERQGCLRWRGAKRRKANEERKETKWAERRGCPGMAGEHARSLEAAWGGPSLLDKEDGVFENASGWQTCPGGPRRRRGVDMPAARDFACAETFIWQLARKMF